MKLTGNHCKCAACGEFFNSVSSFDYHRRGKYDIDAPAYGRYCAKPGEMGMSKNRLGYWIEKARPASTVDRISGDLQSVGSG